MEMVSPEKVAEAYGGDKARIAQAARMGVIDPTTAVMAGMFIDRIRGAAAEERAPKTSVAQDVMQGPTMEAGIASLPVPEREYAGGGIVAFADGGDVVYDPMTGLPIYGEPPRNTKISLGELFGTDTQQNLRDFLGVPPTDKPKPPVNPPPAPRASAVPSKKAADSDVNSFEAYQDLLKKAGVDDSLAARVRQQVAEGREKSAGEREDARNMALINAGLSVLGGKSPYALQNLGLAKAGVESYAADIKALKADEKERLKVERDLDMAEDARKRGDVKTYMEFRDKAEQRDIQRQQANAAIAHYNRPSQFAEMMAAYKADPEGFAKAMAAQKPGFETAEVQKLKVGLEQINKALIMMKPKDPNRPALEARRDQILNALSSGDSGGMQKETGQKAKFVGFE